MIDDYIDRWILVVIYIYENDNVYSARFNRFLTLLRHSRHLELRFFFQMIFISNINL